MLVRHALAALVFLLVVAASCQAAVLTVTTIRTGDSSEPFAFDPPSITVQVGDTVRWLNGDGAYHTTANRAQDGGSNGDEWQGILGSKDTTFEHTFDEAGTFAYFCQPHATFMEGTVTVAGDGSGGGSDEDDSNDSPGWGLPLLLGGLFVAFLAKRRSARH